ncbi:hypothetical protein Thiowin_04725 [Thiorhodovibrio winogradskyi]|uniref:Uncharacterized protein n=1 Tax=Thiorhodovibrio winogradskyi TaxID=77007 RepID=A0ABZ0SH18_9GAMM|nr:hypothetical protein [Thiorhodovibrio winogradskyi]
MRSRQRQHLFIASLIMLSSLAPSLPAQAYDGLDLYDCVISDQDRFNSKGVRLTSVRNILAQDRANYHKFNRRDTLDSADQTFLTPGQRQLWQSARVDIDPALRAKILNGGAVAITVYVFSRDWIEVREGLIPPGVS